MRHCGQFIYEGVYSEVQIDKDACERLGILDSRIFFKSLKFRRLSIVKRLVANVLMSTNFGCLVFVSAGWLLSFVKLAGSMTHARVDYPDKFLLTRFGDVPDVYLCVNGDPLFKSSEVKSCSYKSVKELSCFLSYSERLSCVLESVFVFLFLLSKFSKEKGVFKKSLIVNSYDFLDLIVLHRVFLNGKKVGVDFFTDTHYQRWVFLMRSGADADLVLLQHGFISENLCLKYSIDWVSKVYIYSDDFAPGFARLFPNAILVVARFGFDVVDCFGFDSLRNVSVLFISSPVDVDFEYDFLEQLSLRFPDIKFIHRIHPLFRGGVSNKSIYGVNKNVFVDLGGLFPKVDLVISNNSFLGYRYSSAGFNVVHFDAADTEFLFELIGSL